MVLGICPRCSSYEELVVHLFNAQEVPCLCKKCEDEIHKDVEDE